MRTHCILARVDGLSINLSRIGAGRMFFDIVPRVRDGDEGKRRPERKPQGWNNGPSDASDLSDASDGPDRRVLPASQIAPEDELKSVRKPS